MEDWNGNAESVGLLLRAELGKPGHIIIVILGTELLVELGHWLIPGIRCEQTQ